MNRLKVMMLGQGFSGKKSFLFRFVKNYWHGEDFRWPLEDFFEKTHEGPPGVGALRLEFSYYCHDVINFLLFHALNLTYNAKMMTIMMLGNFSNEIQFCTASRCICDYVFCDK
mmetsp:Transcript_36157/g.56633  ORF Transcript_36157/g.56633 Transcript_36157/m.56633 type:complete len:113 (-) Transcript_36157:248-586(-)